MKERSEELMEKREKAIAEMLGCLTVIAKGEFTGDVPARMAAICIGEMHRLIVGQERPAITPGFYVSAAESVVALNNIRMHADYLKDRTPDGMAKVHVLAIHGHVDRVLGPRKVN